MNKTSMQIVLFLGLALALHTAIATDGQEWERTNRVINSTNASSSIQVKVLPECQGWSLSFSGPNLNFSEVDRAMNKLPRCKEVDPEKFDIKESTSSNGWSWSWPLLVQLGIFIVLVLILIYLIIIHAKIAGFIKNRVPHSTEESMGSTIMDV